MHAIRGCLRSYDPIIRIGGDEFLCLVTAARIEDVRGRFGSVQAELAGGDDPGWIRVGFAALAPADSAAALIQRADANLPAAGGRRAPEVGAPASRRDS